MILGRVLLECFAVAGGHLADCTVVEANPASSGDAAVKLSKSMKMRPATKNGLPWGKIVVPIMFRKPIDDLSAPTVDFSPRPLDGG
jgi:hypothetical protein